MANISTRSARPRRGPLPRRLADVLTTALLLYAATSTSASAYIDPGSGGAIITGILGFLAAIAYTTRKYWYRIKGLFGAKSADKPSEIPPR